MAVLGRRIQRLDAVVSFLCLHRGKGSSLDPWVLVVLAARALPCFQGCDRVTSCALQASQLKHGVSIVGDLTKEVDMKRAIQEAIDRLGGLDIIVNRQASPSITGQMWDYIVQILKFISWGCSGGATTNDMMSADETAFISALKLHVTGVFQSSPGSLFAALTKVMSQIAFNF